MQCELALFAHRQDISWLGTVFFLEKVSNLRSQLTYHVCPIRHIDPSVVSVAANVATKLTSAVFSWWGSGDGGAASKKKEITAEEKAQLEPAAPLPLQRCLRDAARTVTSVTVSADRRLAATCDSFGRVVLWDLTRLVALRFWKGYRDAQVAFMTAPCDQTGTTSASANRGSAVSGSVDSASPTAGLFLALYLGRRGLVEVWRVPLGVRVGIVQVGAGCLLRYAA